MTVIEIFSYPCPYSIVNHLHSIISLWFPFCKLHLFVGSVFSSDSIPESHRDVSSLWQRFLFLIHNVEGVINVILKVYPNLQLVSFLLPLFMISKTYSSLQFFCSQDLKSWRQSKSWNCVTWALPAQKSTMSHCGCPLSNITTDWEHPLSFPVQQPQKFCSFSTPMALKYLYIMIRNKQASFQSNVGIIFKSDPTIPSSEPW
jgi:hypothetical protein